ncbi:MAG: peptidase U32 family protein [Schaedlerella sp.]|nr:peptidase U32 family protein [Schaedlerella sp.]
MKAEVLAPVGRLEDLQLMIDSGADAVYVGLRSFSSRPSLVDLDVGEILQAAEVCHQQGVKIYVAINAFVGESQMAELKEKLFALDEGKVDALILSEVGLIADIIGKLKYSVIHASTLLGAYNLRTVRILKDLGVKRIIFYANLYLDEMALIMNAEPNLEYELVAEGGTCFNDIRQCCLPHTFVDGEHRLFCREEYELAEGDTRRKAKAIAEYPVRSAEIAGMYMAMGIQSFKIEGRTVEGKYRTEIVKRVRKYVDEYEEIPAKKAYLHYVSRLNRESM